MRELDSLLAALWLHWLDNQIGFAKAAKHTGCGPGSVRKAVENGAEGLGVTRS